MSEESKALIRSTWTQVFNEGNLDAIDENFAADAAFLAAAPGISPDRKGFRQMVGTYRSAFPDLRIEFEEQVAEGDKVASRLTFTGTHQGELAGIAATGKEVSIPAFNLIEVKDGKITSVRGLSDQFLMWQQIGAVPG